MKKYTIYLIPSGRDTESFNITAEKIIVQESGQIIFYIGEEVVFVAPKKAVIKLER